MIVFEDVSLVYPNGVHALSNVNLNVARGEILFLVGSTGQGKSRVLKCIYREAQPSAGDVVVDDWRLSTLPNGQVPLLRRKVGVVFQDFKLLRGKTVWENVAYALQVTGASSRDVMRRVPRALELVGSSHSMMSGLFTSERAIAVHNPLIMLCDEPTGN